MRSTTQRRVNTSPCPTACGGSSEMVRTPVLLVERVVTAMTLLAGSNCRGLCRPVWHLPTLAGLCNQQSEPTAVHLAERPWRAQPQRGSSCSPSATLPALIRSRSRTGDGDGTALSLRRPYLPEDIARPGRHPSAACPYQQDNCYGRSRPCSRHVYRSAMPPCEPPICAGFPYLTAVRSAPPGAASRGADRRQAAPQRRRAPAPCAGLDEVGKVVPHP